MMQAAHMIRAGFAMPLLVLAAEPAQAELPDPVRKMVEAAIESGDPAKVDAIISVAKQTNPDDEAELDAMKAAFEQHRKELASKEAEAKEAEIRSAGLLERWKGRGQIGAFQSSGNSNNIGVSVALSLTREGIDWSHRINASMDY